MVSGHQQDMCKGFVGLSAQAESQINRDRPASPDGY